MVFVAVYVLGLVSFCCLIGHAWRTWHFWQRGIERIGVGQGDGQPVQDRLGVNVELEQYDLAELDVVVRDLLALDVYWLRQHFVWQAIEPQPGDYDWVRWDAIIDAVRGHDLGLIAVLDRPPAWAARQDGFPLPCVPPYDQAAYARFVSAFAARYGDVIDHYQVWDEPNLSRYWGGGHVAPCAYAVMLEAAYPAVHAADATAWVLGGGLAPTQAPGPDNLNDLFFLRQVYAAGGGRFFDILAVKPYGFWSGPEDRRVDPDVLNFSRTIAVRELMHDLNDAHKPIWAVEWGWNVLPTDGQDAPMPWGGDEIVIQTPRIIGAVSRARVEWPWLGPMCWASYQPNVPPGDPKWSFALRDSNGTATPLYGVLDGLAHSGAAMHEGDDRAKDGFNRPFVWPWSVVLPVILLGLVVPWFGAGWRAGAQDLWCAFKTLSPAIHLGILAILIVIYALVPTLEWVLLACAGAVGVFCVHPRWALLSAVFGIPFFYLVKPIGRWRIVPAEMLLLLALVSLIVRHGMAVFTAEKKWTMLDLMWAVWVLSALMSIPSAPDPVLAWRAWRLNMLGPALLYAILEFEKEKKSVLVTWVASGLVVASIGIGQWLAGALMQAGSVERVTSVYYSPNHLALYLERMWPLTLAWALNSDQGRRKRIWSSVAMLVLGIGLYLTLSRGAWMLAIPAALLVVGWQYRHHLRWWMVGAGLAILALTWFGISGERAPSSLLDEVRLPVWQSTAEMVSDHLWTGIGLDGFQFVYPRYMRAEAWTEPLLYHPHNMWLDVAVQLGVPGAMILIVLVGIGLVQTVRSDTLSRATRIGLLAGLVAALAHGLVDSGYFLSDLAWSFALIMGTVRSDLFRGQTRTILL
ncbi:MAG: O-antigen ligase family protein [Anaerolineae bacterium]|nr:O-antigen ligase family protein [Anaerolineae bacterium]